MRGNTLTRRIITFRNETVWIDTNDAMSIDAFTAEVRRGLDELHTKVTKGCETMEKPIEGLTVNRDIICKFFAHENIGDTINRLSADGLEVKVKQEGGDFYIKRKENSDWNLLTKHTFVVYRTGYFYVMDSQAFRCDYKELPDDWTYEFTQDGY